MVGGFGVVVNSTALLALHQWAGLPLLVASPLAVELSIVNNFLWNDRWTFLSRVRTRGPIARFAQFNIVSFLGLLITTATTLLLVEQIGLHYLVSNLCGIVLGSLCNFFANVHWTWPTKN
jgi:dolichol-phosphate mannosyltransferase